MKPTSKEDIKKLNSNITLMWVKILSPALGVIILLSIGAYDRFNFLNSLKSNNSFICEDDHDLIYIQIDKKDGWMLKDDYFIKGKNKISQEICKSIKKDKQLKYNKSNISNKKLKNQIKKS